MRSGTQSPARILRHYGEARHLQRASVTNLSRFDIQVPPRQDAIQDSRYSPDSSLGPAADAASLQNLSWLERLTLGGKGP